MDHLTWSSRSLFPRPVVPYLASQEVDCTCANIAEFKAWARTRNWNREETSLSHWAARSQSWLYFGLLRIILRDSFRLEDFVFDGFVSSQNLQQLLDQHIQLDDVGSVVNDHRELNEFGRNIVQALEIATMAFEQAIVPVTVKLEGDNDNAWNSAPYRVIFSVCILLDHIYVFLSSGLVDRELLRRQSHAFTNQTNGIAEALRAVGRCPSLLERLTPRPQLVYSLMSFAMLTDHNKHVNCSKEHCQTFDVDKKKYESAHTDDCSGGVCRRQGLGFSYKDICDIIDRDAIPLVRSTRDLHGNINVVLEASRKDSQYTAISHVWAGGLGNFEENKLPECQLHKMHEDVVTVSTHMAYEDSLRQKSKLLPAAAAQLGVSYLSSCLTNPYGTPPSALYWIDTLCIPIAPGNDDEAPLGASRSPGTQFVRVATDQDGGSSLVQVTADASVVPTAPKLTTASSNPPPYLHKKQNDPYRQKAINSMARIYAGAQHVLVLDPELKKEDTTQLTPFERSLAIATCPWMARSWTLQEGALAINVQLKFADGIQRFSRSDIDGRFSRLLHGPLVGDVWFQDLLDDVHPELTHSLIDYAAREFCRAMIAGSINRMKFMRRGKVSTKRREIKRFMNTWNDLATRSTTEPDDVAAILAALCEFSAGEVLGHETPKGRMKALLKSQSTLPISILMAPTMEKDVTIDWTPIFPNAKTSTIQMTAQSFDILVTNAGLTIAPPPYLYEASSRSIPQRGVVYLRFGNGSICEVSFPGDSNTDSPTSSGPVLFWFPDVRDSAGTRLGRWFQYMRDEADVIHVSMGNIFTWKHSKDYDFDRPNNQDDRCYDVRLHAISNPATSKSLNIDIDIRSWPDLKWSRTRAFPFVQLALGQERVTDLLTIFPWIAVLIPAIISGLSILDFGNWSRDNSRVKETYKSFDPSRRFVFWTLVLSVPVGVFLLRWLCASVEDVFIRQIEFRWVHETWAASFWDVSTKVNRQTRTVDHASVSNSPLYPATEPSIVDAAETQQPFPSHSPTTLADATLRNTWPVFAVKVLLFSALIWLVSAIVFLSLYQRFDSPRPEWKFTKWTQEYYIFPLAAAYADHPLLAALAIVSLQISIEMFWRVVAFTLYLRKWRQISRSRSVKPRLQDDGLSATHKTVQILAWTFYVCIIIFLFAELGLSISCLKEEPSDSVYILGTVVFSLFCVLVVGLRTWPAFRAVFRYLRSSQGSQHGIAVQLKQLYRRIREPEGRIQI